MSNYLGSFNTAPSLATDSTDRVAFIRKTYVMLSIAIAMFVGFEALFLQLGIGDMMVNAIRGAGRLGWIAVLVMFMAAGWVATRIAHSDVPAPMQFLALTGYAAIEAVIFLPLMTMAIMKSNIVGQNLPLQAGVITLIVFGGLTAVVLISKKDFSFLGYGISVAGLIMLAVIVAASIFGPVTSWLFIGIVVLLIALAAASILYETSMIRQHYPTDKHIGAALVLFASVATLYYNILMLFMQTSSDD
jgi:uncharacterized protein